MPRDRVRLDAETVTEERQVGDDVGKQRIEVRGDGRDRRRWPATQRYAANGREQELAAAVLPRSWPLVVIR